jgi:branched-chain amino acid transport system permease protein
MLSLALAQAIWAGATQWVGLTGGDNGLIGLQLVDADSRDGVGLALLVMVVVAWTLLWRLSQSSWGAALQAARDAPQRALASGLPVARLRHQVLVLSAALAGLAGAWWAAIKGAVFPSVASVATSVDALLVVLLGGLHQVWGALVGSTLLIAGAAELGRGLDYWRGWLGLLIMLLMVGAPSGLLSALQRWRLRQEGRS